MSRSSRFPTDVGTDVTADVDGVDDVDEDEDASAVADDDPDVPVPVEPVAGIVRIQVEPSE